MKRVLKIVGRISDKGGRAKTFSLVLCSVLVLLLVASVYNVFGDGATGAAVAELSNGYFRDSDKLGGWEYVDTGKVYTAYSETVDMGDDRKAATIYSAPEFVKEGGKLKNKEDAKSWLGYYTIRFETDDPELITELIDLNQTSITFKYSIADVEKVDKSIPVKIEGIMQKSLNFNSVGEKQEVTLQVDNVLGKYYTFGTMTDNVTVTAVDNNATFADTIIKGLNESETYNKNYGEATLIGVYKQSNLNYCGLVLLNLREVIGSGMVIYNLTYHPFADQINANNGDATFFEVVEGWNEGESNGEAGNASWNSPNDTYQSSSGDAVWTTGASPGAGPYDELKDEVKGATLGNYTHLGPTCEPCYWIDIDLTENTEGLTAVQRMYGGTGGISLGINITDAWVSGYYAFNLRSIEYVNYVPQWYVEFGINIAPTIPAGVTITESPAQDNFDLSCTFTPVDPDNETLTTTLEWYNNTGAGGVLAYKYEGLVVNNDTTAEAFALKHENTTIGENWSCGVQVCDTYECSGWSNSSETEIVSIENKTDFTEGLGNIRSNKVKSVFVYDTSGESWNRENSQASWFTAKNSFPEKVYLVLHNLGLDVVYTNGSGIWMDFVSGSGNAINGNDFTSVYALDGKVYVGSDLGLYVLDFANDNITRYSSSGFADFDSTTPFDVRNSGSVSYFILDGAKQLASSGVNDVHANTIRGKHLVGVATDSGVNIVNMQDLSNVNDDTIAKLIFNAKTNDQDKYDSDSVFVADDGTLYYSENYVGTGSALGNTKLSYRYNIQDYTGTTENSGSDKYYLSNNSNLVSTILRSSNYPRFLSEKINDIYVTSGTSRRQSSHNTIYVATEKGVSVIQENQDKEGNGRGYIYGYAGSSEPVDYKVLEGVTDNITAVTARTDGNAIYVGTSSGNGFGSVSKVSLNSNTLVDSWNTTTDPSIVGNDTTSLGFLDGYLLIGTLDSGATDVLEQELDLYLVTDYTKHRVIEIDNTGLIHWQFGTYNTPGSNNVTLTNPTDAVRLTNGNTLIADYGNKRILEVDSNGAVVREIGNATQLSDATYLDGVYSVKKV